MKNIVLVKLNGGLGNQMFQYALAKIIAVRNNSEILLDKELFQLTEKKPGHTPRDYELEIFGINNSSASSRDINYFERLPVFHKIKRELHLNYPKMCYERNFGFDEGIKNASSPVYLRGFFQSFKYLKGYEDVIREVFRFPESKLDEKNKYLLDKIKLTTSASVHIRRGDYVEDKITKEFHGNCSLDYYHQAILKIKSIDKEVEFFFFSDDIDWVKKEFKDLPIKKTFVSSNTGKNSWIDMLLMSYCTHNIIANSSFSWWAAWLNKNNSKKVIAPKRWFKNPEKEKYTFDLIPEEWIRI